MRLKGMMMASKGTWIAALMVGTALSGGPGVMPAQAAETAEQVAQGIEAKVFDIAPQPLADAVALFGRQAGLQVSAESALLGNRTSPGVSGSMTANEALSRLLAGSGLSWRFSGSRTVVLERTSASGAIELEPVTVQGIAPVPSQAQIGNPPPAYAGGQVATGARMGVLGNRSVMDTPHNITAYTSELMTNQQARTVADVLENDPSVRFTTPTGHAMEWYKIRGVEISSETMTLNGMGGVAPYGHLPVDFLERVEVLKGPSAMMNGMSIQSNVGGNINLVPKRAGDKPNLDITGDFMSDSYFGGHVDAGRRFGADGQLGVRVNAAKRGGETGVDGQEKQTLLGALALDYRGDDVRLSLDAYHIKEELNNGSPVTVLLNSNTSMPGPMSNDTNAFRGIWADQVNTGLILRGEYDATKDLTFYAGVGRLWSRMEGFLTSTHLRFVNQDGSVPVTRTTARNDYTDSVSGEAGVRSRFNTGEVGHEVTLGANVVDISNGTASNNSGNFSSNLYNPVSPLLATAPADALPDSWTRMTSFAVADTASFLKDRVLLTVGLRHQGVDYKTYSAATGHEASNYDATAITPVFGVVVKPLDNLSLYGNYVESLTRGARVTNAARANYGEVFDPFVSTQKEVGVKWDAGRFTNTLSAFEIDMKSNLVAINNVEKPFEQRNRGLEWNIFGEVADGVRALGGVSYTKATITESAGGNGNTPFGTPTWLANVGGEWDTPFAPGLTLEGRVVYTGEQYVNNTNQLQLTDWTRFDVGARYVLPVEGRDVTMRAYITNLLDSDYWSGTFSDGVLMQNEGRTYMMSATAGF